MDYLIVILSLIDNTPPPPFVHDLTDKLEVREIMERAEYCLKEMTEWFMLRNILKRKTKMYFRKLFIVKYTCQPTL